MPNKVKLRRGELIYECESFCLFLPFAERKSQSRRTSQGTSVIAGVVGVKIG